MARIYTAAGTIKVCRFVRGSGNNSVVQCGLGERPIGVSQYGSREAPLPSVTADPPEAAQSGDSLEVFNHNTQENILLRVGTGGCAAWDPLVSDANGQGIVGAGAVGAIAMESASANELVPVMLIDPDQPNSLPVIVHEFDTETLVDAASKVILPAVLNKKGLVVMEVFGIVTEVFGGASEDQGIVTVKDSDGNTLATLTPTNAGADALLDIVAGLNTAAASTGTAIKVLAAGKGITAIVSQATSGAGAAGKMKVVVRVMSL